MNKTSLTFSEYWRLYKASRLHKFGHLGSWKELFLYQIHYADPKQLREISLWASRKNRGEDIVLPLKDYKAQASLI